MKTNRFYQDFDFERRASDSRRNAEDIRSPFQQDRDRIIHTGAFRCLQNKTQVFFSGEYDFYRTRLTHSIEVAQIGRGICQQLGANSDLLHDDYYIDADLVEAICLAHDLGHPPFGHTGERVLHRLMKPYGGFEGNAQTLRLIGNTAFNGEKGIDPARATVDGVLKYKTPYGELDDPPNHFIYDDQLDWLAFTMGNRAFPVQVAPGPARDAHKSIECQIMDWADDTAYSLNDIADGIHAGFLNRETIERWAESQHVEGRQAECIEQLLGKIRKDRIESTVGFKIGEFIRHTHLEEQEHFLSDLTNRYRFRLRVDREILEESELYQKMAYELVFRSQQMRQLDRKADLILTRLFEEMAVHYLREEPGRAPGHYQLLSDKDEARIFAPEISRAGRARLVCDAVARMTDGFARRTYKRLFDPDYGSIVDLV